MATVDKNIPVSEDTAHDTIDLTVDVNKGDQESTDVVRTSGSQVESNQAEDSEDVYEEKSSFGFALGQVPGWAVSMLVHAVILVALFCLTFKLEPNNDKMMIVGATEEELEELEQFELTQDDQILELQEVEIPNPVAALELTDFMSTIDLGADAQAEMGEIALEDDITGDIAGLFGASDLGMSQMGGGSGTATFFGVQTNGNRFIYVVDNSNSMSNGKFETAIYEIKKSVALLKPEHEFYVIFYSDASYPLFYPEVQRYPVAATQANKKKLDKWLGTVHRCLRTNGEAAMDLAMRMRPDGLYLLGDGAFGDKAVPKTLANAENNNVIIHTLGFGMKPQAAKSFDELAKAYNGTFQNVEVTAEMRAYSKTVKRPRNNKKNGVWGINLN
ncbi:MAG: hypothetical protein COA78_19915 [Blastopirellula sp.]|nr:MAG: hypothetical protein COA78_19915 [Blastopirellula sp.]